jgi:hypothetical protein
MNVPATIALLGVGLAGLIHLLLTWMDGHGWIFYRSTAPLGTRTANALMEFESLFNPAIEHVIEYRRHGNEWVEVSVPADDE